MECLVVLGGCLTALCTGPRSYLLCRVAVGFAEGGVPTAAWGYASEFLLPSKKAQAITALQLSPNPDPNPSPSPNPNPNPNPSP